MVTLPVPLSNIFVFLINVIGLTLVFNVFVSKVKPILKTLFIAMTILMFIWVDLAFFARAVHDPQQSLLYIRLAWSVTPYLFVLVYSFLVKFLGVNGRAKYLTPVLHTIGASFFCVILFTDLIIRNTFFADGILNIVYGSLVWSFFGFVSLLTFINFFLLIRVYRKPETEKSFKKRVEFLLIGLTIFFVANGLFNIVFPVFMNVFDLYEFGDYSLIIFMSIIAYATVQHQFFNIKVVFSSFIATFLGSFLLLDAALFSNTLETRITKGAIFALYIPFAYLFVRSVLVEIKQKEQLQILNQKLKELDKQKDEFISLASHELRAPLTAVKGYVSMIIDGDFGSIPAGALDSLKDVSSVTDRLVRLVSNMLNVSRIEKGKLTYNMGTTRLSEVASMVFKEFKITAEAKGLQINLQIPPGLRDLVYVDTDRIHEVATNLVSNATKYTEKGSVTIKLSNPDMNWVRMEIIDTGSGISKEEQQRLFEKFVRVESKVGKTVGSGLGLYICKLLIHKFEGKLGLVSEPGKGSNFWFELPINKNYNENDAKRPKSAAAVASADQPAAPAFLHTTNPAAGAAGPKTQNNFDS